MSWTIAGNSVEPSSDIELTASALSLSFEVDESELSTWRNIGDRAGDLTVGTGFGGALRTLARGTGGAVTVAPDNRETPPFAAGEWYVSDFEETQIAPSRYNISLGLQRPTNRRGEFSGLTDTDVSAADEGFGIDFGINFGAPDPDLPLYLSLQRGEGLTLGISASQLGQLSRDGGATGATVTAPLLLSDEQAAALADAAGFPDGVVERAVPDGDSRLIDESGGRQTIVADTRGTVPLADSEWLILGWSIEWHSHTPERRWRAEIELAETI